MRDEWKPISMSLDEVTICRSYTFEAAHFLPKLPEGHKCRRMHGHSYKIDVRITGKPDDMGLVRGIEFGVIDTFMEPVLISLDHHTWNDKLEDPTVENIAGYIATIISKGLGVPVTVRAYEGPRSWAQVSVQ